MNSKINQIALALLVSCSSYPQPDHIAVHGIDVYGHPQMPAVNAAIDGAVGGYGFQFGKDSQPAMLRDLSAWAEVHAHNRDELECRADPCVAYSKGPEAHYVLRGDCPEKALGHEMAHVIAYLVGHDISHDNSAYFGVWSVSFFAEGAARSACE